MKLCTLALTVAGFLPGHVYTLSTQQDGVAGKTDDRGTFQNPSARVRTKFRYWVPDASIDVKEVAEDIRAVSQIGGGGVELLPFYNYGDHDPGFIPVDWTQYGWGTPAWRKLQDAAIEATKENNLVIDLALGPNQGAGVPAPVNAEGLQWDLQPFNTSVALGDSFDGTLPGWGVGELVAAVVGVVANMGNSTEGIIYTLDVDSLQDISDGVSPDGHLKHTFPESTTGKHGVVFAYYLIHTQYHEQRSPLEVISGDGVRQSPVTSFVQNGSWVVDHFSANGAAQVRQFWEQHLLNGGETVQTLAQVGRYLWEDSQEFPSNILWTPTVPNAFEKQHGYSIAKYLPILMHDNGGGIFSGAVPPDPPDYITNEIDGGAKYVADYRQTMTDLNKNYLAALTDFAHSLGLESNTQVGYNLPIDMLSNIPYVDAPECETLGFDPQIDTYRQFVGPAGLAGKQVVSLEAGAVFNTAYQQSIPEQLNYLKRSVVGGVNSFKLHGMSFSGNYGNTTWPGFVPFSFVVAEMHNQRQPGWDYYNDWMDYTARVQHAMQIGVAKVDLAIWLKPNTSATLVASYQDTDLTASGYTYEYLSPDNFDLPNAYVKEGILAPSQQAFRALMIRANDTLTVGGVETVGKWAHQGLQIVFSGGLPSQLDGNVSPAQQQKVKKLLNQISQLNNVHVVPEGRLAHSLGMLGITPRFESDGSTDLWYSRWREDDEEVIVFVYYDATGLAPDTPSTNKTVTFAALGTPYEYDAWTGDQRPLDVYTQSNGRTTLSLSLAGNQTTMIAFRKNQAPHYATASQDPVDCDTETVQPIVLSHWNLTIESWSAPSNISDIQGTVKTNVSYTIDDLLPWSKLPVPDNLTLVAGRGYYRTSFSWPPADQTATKALLVMSPIIHTAVLRVNGQHTAALDVTAPRADISAYLVAGENVVEVIVSTPLGNALIPVADKIRSASGDLSLVESTLGFTPVRPREYGLVGQVVVYPH